MVMVEMKGKAQDFWAAEFLKELENTFQNIVE